jgi:hypothetical protein
LRQWLTKTLNESNDERFVHLLSSSHANGAYIWSWPTSDLSLFIDLLDRFDGIMARYIARYLPHANNTDDTTTTSTPTITATSSSISSLPSSTNIASNNDSIPFGSNSSSSNASSSSSITASPSSERSVILAILRYSSLLLFNCSRAVIYNSIDRIRCLLDDEHDDIVISSLQLLYQLLRHTSVRNALTIRNDTRLRARLVILATSLGPSYNTDMLTLLTSARLSLKIGDEISLTLPSLKPSKHDGVTNSKPNSNDDGKVNHDHDHVDHDLSTADHLSSNFGHVVTMSVKELTSAITRSSLVDQFCRRYGVAPKHRFAVSQQIRQAQMLVSSSSTPTITEVSDSDMVGIHHRYNGVLIKLLALRALMSMSWLRREVVGYLQRTEPLLLEGLLDVIKSSDNSTLIAAPSLTPLKRPTIPLYIRVMILETISSLAQHPVFVTKLRNLSVTTSILPFLLRNCITRIASISSSENGQPPRVLLEDHYQCYSLLELSDRLLPTSAMDAGPWLSPSDTMDDMLLLLRTSSVTSIPLLYRALGIIERLIAQQTLLVCLYALGPLANAFLMK